MEKLSEVVRRYLRAQIAAGVDAVQLFDSWVGDLSPGGLREERLLPYVRRILVDVETRREFARHPFWRTGTGILLEAMREAGGTVIGVDWCRRPLDQAGRALAIDRAVQGNMDPCALLATREVAMAHAERGRRAAATRTWALFNLGHGILPETPVETVEAVVDYVHESTDRSLAPRALISMSEAVLLISHGTVDRLDEPGKLRDQHRQRSTSPPPSSWASCGIDARGRSAGCSPLNAISAAVGGQAIACG